MGRKLYAGTVVTPNGDKLVGLTGIFNTPDQARKLAGPDCLFFSMFAHTTCGGPTEIDLENPPKAVKTQLIGATAWIVDGPGFESGDQQDLPQDMLDSAQEEAEEWEEKASLEELMD